MSKKDLYVDHLRCSVGAGSNVCCEEESCAPSDGFLNSPSKRHLLSGDGVRRAGDTRVPRVLTSVSLSVRADGSGVSMLRDFVSQKSNAAPWSREAALM